MEITITKEEFDAAVPAFRTPTKDIYNKMQTELDTVRREWEDAIADDVQISEKLIDKIKQAVAIRAAYLAVPHLDLVLTATGFGVVSNTNTAPASRERVNSLREQLRQEASYREDTCVENLVEKSALRSPAATVDSLLWSAKLFRKYGILAEDKKPVYREEKEGLSLKLFHAEEKVKELISPELYEALTAEEWNGTKQSSTRTLCTEIARRVMASFIYRGANYAGPKALTRELLNFVRDNITEFPEYANSRTAAAQNYQRYENKKEDTCFFFG